MSRFYFDVNVKDGTVEQDLIGVDVPDTATALHDCIDTIMTLTPGEVLSVTVRNENGAGLMVLYVDAIRPQGPGNDPSA